MARDELCERINLRVKMMIEKGLEQEVKGLLDKGVTFEDPAMKALPQKISCTEHQRARRLTAPAGTGKKVKR